MIAVQVVFWMLMPTALAYLAVHLPKLLRFLRDTSQRLWPAPERASGPSVERLAADLRRISRDLDAVAAADRMPGRVLRLRTICAAYDDVLLLACRTLNVPPAGKRSPLSSEQRLETEAALAGAGLVW